LDWNLLDAPSAFERLGGRLRGNRVSGSSGAIVGNTGHNKRQDRFRLSHMVKPKLRVSEPLWLASRPRHGGVEYAALDRDLDVDVAIVGGGVTGAAVAWMFARDGVRVALLEAARIGRGSTSASTALLMQEPDTDFGALARRYGSKNARRIWRRSSASTRDFVRTLQALHIRCHLEHLDSVYYALHQAAGRRLHDEWRQRRRARIPGRWLDAAALRRVTGIEGAGAIRTSGDAQVDPYRACTGLLHAAARRGARIFERSPVGRTRSSGSGAALVCNGFNVRCARVIVATGYATPFFKPLAAHFRLWQTYVLATKPVPARVRRLLGLGRVMLWDAGRPYHYARWTSDDRLVLGGGDRPRVPERQRQNALRSGVDGVWRFFQQRYPALGSVDIDFSWEGLFATTPDGLPYVGPHPDYPNHLFALGYGGNGMTFGFLAARLLLDAYRGQPTDDHQLFSFARRAG
jgi:glycine/D-amino acid oxidase-like deaminating enzyme